MIAGTAFGSISEFLVRGGSQVTTTISVGGASCNSPCISWGNATANTAGFKFWDEVQSGSETCPSTYVNKTCTVNPLPNDLWDEFEDCGDAAMASAGANSATEGIIFCGLIYHNSASLMPSATGTAGYDGLFTGVTAGFSSTMRVVNGYCETENGEVPWQQVHFTGGTGTGAASSTMTRVIPEGCELKISVHQEIEAYYEVASNESRAHPFEDRDISEIMPRFPQAQFVSINVLWKDSNNQTISSDQIQRVVGITPAGTIPMLGEGDDESGSESTSGGVTVKNVSSTYDDRVSPAGATKVEVNQSHTAFFVDGNVNLSSDGRSDNADLIALATFNGMNFGDALYKPWADLNLDGTVDSADYAVLATIGCPADFNSDDFVDDTDFLLFLTPYGNYVDVGGDFNGDGLTEDMDFVLFLDFYDAFACPSRDVIPTQP